MPTQHMPSALAVLPGILVLLTLEQADVIALEPTTLKIKMFTPLSANIVSGYPLSLPTDVVASGTPMSWSPWAIANTFKWTAGGYTQLSIQVKCKYALAEVYILG